VTTSQATSPTFELEGPDKDVIARQLTQNRKRYKKVDLAAAIQTVRIRDHIKGSSYLEVTITDPEWELLKSGFFDPNKDGRLDAIDIKYPREKVHGKDFWWRLTQVSVSADRMLTLTLMERKATFLMELKGPVKAKSRSKTTRAEFIKWLCDHVKKDHGIDFHSRELHKKQRVANQKHERTGNDRERNKDGGIHRSENLTMKGLKATPAQLDQCARALDVAADLDAPRLAVIAMVVAGIGESVFRPVVNSLGYGGVFQGQVNTGGHYFNVNDTEKMARHFLLGGKGFQAGGAIHLVRSGVKDVGDIATRVEASGKDGSFYGQYRNEAERLIEAYGGGDFTSTSRYKQYNFDVGSPDNPHESYWDAINRLAEEVNWAWFMDGDDAYFDSEMTLIKQKPIALIKRTDASVVDWNYDWDTRRIATEMTLVLICKPFAFRAGHVFKLEGFGPASRGSTAELPGRWLVAEIDRNEDRLSSTFTLRQPTKPNPEPAPDIVEKQLDTKGGPIQGSPREIINEIVIPIARDEGINITIDSNDAANARHGPTINGDPSDHQGPPDRAWAADMSNGSSPTPQMDSLFKRLASRFDIDVSTSGSEWGAFSVTHGGYRFQIIYRSNIGGNHWNHVHFGIRRV
jgi:hypothetical protein